MNLNLKELALELVTLWSKKPADQNKETQLAADGEAGNEGGNPDGASASVEDRLSSLEAAVKEILTLLNEKLQANADGDVAMNKQIADITTELSSAKEQLTKLSREPDRTVHLKKTTEQTEMDPQVAMLLARRKEALKVSKN